jgi:hypothetical protein
MKNTIKYPGHMKTAISAVSLVSLPLVVQLIEGRPVRLFSYGIIPAIIFLHYLDECGVKWKSHKMLTVLKYAMVALWYTGILLWVVTNPVSS